MRDNDQLLQLIRTLTGNEISFFLRHTQRMFSTKNKKYLDLFKHFEKNKQLDSTSIKQGIKDPEIIRFYNQYKQYLFDFLVEALSVYSRKDFIETEVQQLINEAYFLYHKAMPQAALKRAEKASRLADEAGLDLYHTVIHQLMQRISYTSAYRISIESELDRVKMHKEIDQWNKKYIHAGHLFKANGLIQMINASSSFRDDERYEDLKQEYGKIQRKLDRKEFNAIVKYNKLQFLEYQLHNELNKEQFDKEVVVKLIQQLETHLLESGSQFSRANFLYRLNLLNLLSSTMLCLKTPDRADDFSNQMMTISTASLTEQNKQYIYHLVSQIDIDFFRNDGLKKAEKVCEEYKGVIAAIFAKDVYSLDEILLLHKVSIINYRHKRYRDAYRMNTKIYTQLSEQSYSELQVVVTIFMIILMQVYDYSDYEYAVKSAAPIIEKARDKNGVVEKLITTITIINESFVKKEKSEHLDQLQEYIQKNHVKVRYGSFGYICIHEFDLNNWLNEVRKILEL
jgi:hypothetical protein